jgi:hypothetical protein
LVSNTLIGFTYITQQKERVLEKIDYRLFQIENDLKDIEIQTINAMYQEFNIDKDDQQTINSLISQYKEFQQQYLSQTNKKECITVESLSSKIQSFCKNLNINPAAVEIKISNISSPLVAETKGLRASYQFENDKLIIENIVGHPAITLFPSFFELSDEQQLGVMCHEFNHLALKHHEIHNILGMEIKYFIRAKTGKIINSSEVIKSKNWKRLENIYERQAEALQQDPDVISLMRNKRNKVYYAEHLFLKHYGQLTEIDELHKLKKMFSVSIPYHQIEK